MAIETVYSLEDISKLMPSLTKKVLRKAISTGVLIAKYLSPGRYLVSETNLNKWLNEMTAAPVRTAKAGAGRPKADASQKKK